MGNNGRPGEGAELPLLKNVGPLESRRGRSLKYLFAVDKKDFGQVWEEVGNDFGVELEPIVGISDVVVIGLIDRSQVLFPDSGISTSFSPDRVIVVRGEPWGFSPEAGFRDSLVPGAAFWKQLPRVLSLLYSTLSQGGVKLDAVIIAFRWISQGNFLKVEFWVSKEAGFGFSEGKPGIIPLPDEIRVYSDRIEKVTLEESGRGPESLIERRERVKLPEPVGSFLRGLYGIAREENSRV